MGCPGIFQGGHDPPLATSWGHHCQHAFGKSLHFRYQPTTVSAPSGAPATRINIENKDESMLFGELYLLLFTRRVPDN